VEGRILAADESGVDLDVAGSARRLDYQDLTRGRVQVEFRRIDDTDDVDGDEG
jgi:ribosome maturation factor RimP